MQFQKDKLYFVKPDAGIDPDIEAVSTNLSGALVVQAYKTGLFPWFEQNDFFFWFNPKKRSVLFPENLKVTKSMRNVLNQKKFRITFDEAFDEVIENCASIPRKGNESTWIGSDFKSTYKKLHEQNIAHSVEAWNNKNELVGGLYGIILGKVFFGESMFSKESNASKVCFIEWIKMLEIQNFKLIDCQVHNPHLASLGAEEIPKKEFLELLTECI